MVLTLLSMYTVIQQGFINQIKIFEVTLAIIQIYLS